MHLCGGRTMAAVTMAMVFRHTSGFVAPVRAAVRQTAGSRASNVRCWMSYASTTPRVHVRARVSVPILDAESAELKAERLWGMADARKPCSLDSDNVGVSQEVESRLRDSQKSPSMVDMAERDDFVEEEGEVSALRRYQYDELVDYEGGDDGKEYYI